MKDRLVLKDLTEIELETGGSLGNLGVLFPDKAAMAATWDRFTTDNLSAVQIKNGDGLVAGNYTDLVLVSETSMVRPDGRVLTSFNIREKTDVEKLSDRLDAVEEGQAVQDGAIMDVAEIVSVIADTQEGGMA